MTETRRLGRLLADSLDLACERLGAYAAVVAAGLLPGALLLAAGMQALGLTGEESIRAAVSAGLYGQVAAMAGLGLAALLCRGFAFIALGLMLAARSEGRDLDLAAAFESALDFALPMLRVFVRVLLYVLGGLILLILPGILLAIRYCLAHWAVLLEGRRGSQALARSQEILLAHMGKAVGNLFVSGLLVALLSLAIVFGLAVAVTMAGLGKPEPGAWAHALALEFVKDLVQGTVGVWGVAFSILLYKDLAALHPLAAAQDPVPSPQSP